MFPISDPYLQLQLHHQRTAELRQATDAYRLARAVGAGRHRRFGHRPRASARPRPVHAPVAS
jgi:hypothetical protein